MVAVGQKKLENVKILLEWEADVERADMDGKTFVVRLGQYGFENKSKEKLLVGTKLGQPQCPREIQSLRISSCSFIKSSW